MKESEERKGRNGDKVMSWKPRDEEESGGGEDAREPKVQRNQHK